jgi:hypothetical protein
MRNSTLSGQMEDEFMSYIWLSVIAVLSTILYHIVVRSEDAISLVVGVRNPNIAIT